MSCVVEKKSHPSELRGNALPLRRMANYAWIGLTACIAAGCYSLRPSQGGGQVDHPGPRKLDLTDIAVPDGYVAEVIATGLTFPTSIAFDAKGEAFVAESGYAYGEKFGTARLLRLGPGGSKQTVAESKNGPWTGVTFHDGNFYVAEGGEVEGGRILRISPEGKTSVLVRDLPSRGDHHTNGPAVGADGWVYFGQGTATNSAIVGEDNEKMGWLHRDPTFHDVPCRDVTLTGENFESDNVLAKGGARVKTGAYVPFATATSAGQVIAGQVPCNGAVLRVRPEGGAVELVAWGLRNPFGLAFSPDGALYVTDNGADERGSRPLFGSADVLWRIEPGAWYGWPDFSEGRPAFQERYASPGKSKPARLLANHPSVPPKPVAYLAVHASADGLDFSRSAEFGHVGQAFIAIFGDQAPQVGKTLSPVGYKVVRVDVKTGVIYDFFVNRGKTNGPASLLERGGIERPVAVRFDPSGKQLYVVDFGIMKMSDKGATAIEGTGVIWRIRRGGAA